MSKTSGFSTTIKETHQRFVQQLATIYEEREATNIAAIVFEDVFGIRNVLRQDVLATEQITQIQAIEERLLTHEPMQYVLGQADFYGLKLKVNSDVLIPRPETEELVWLILEVMKNESAEERLTVLDIGTGSGCIPISLKSKCPHWAVEGMDKSEAALAVARENAQDQELDIHFFASDILQEENWPRKDYDIIISNPPYIPPSERSMMPERVIRYEPGLALFAPEENPYLFYERILLFAEKALLPDGYLFFECNEFNAREVLALAKQMGSYQAMLYQDMNGKDRMLLARRI